MAYITLNELKEILPIILEQWIDEDDESWEWIFQEIEQKCHVIQWINPIDTKQKGKKLKKRIKNDIYQMKSMIDTHSVVISAHRNDINELTKNVNELIKCVTDDLSPRIKRMNNDINAAKSMAETAKQRTEVDYTQMSKVKNDIEDNTTEMKSMAEIIQDVYNRMAGRGATKEELDTFRNVIHKYDALEKKEMPVIKKIEDCQTCKYVDKYPNCPDCGNNYSAWEAKDDG